MLSVEGFDLNIEPADVSFADDPITIYLINVSQDDPIAMSQDDPVAIPHVPTLASSSMPVESDGLTVPTAQTATDGGDVEDGIEVLSTPQEPYVGMTFSTPQDARVYYNRYARHAGFSIRIDTSRESKKDNDKRKVIFVCQKAGVNKKQKLDEEGPITEKKIVRQRRKDYVDRTRCPARMIVRKTAPSQWEVVHFEREHNHECVKKFSLTKYMKSHREIPAEEKEFIKFLHGCCITTTRAYQIMVELYGGIENCPYTEGDAKNLRVEYRAEYRGKDMKATIDHFEELKKEDPDFIYSYTLDEFDRVENLFWVDGAARKSYELYGDCISFDTTYLTNMYNMPCAPFIGKNISLVFCACPFFLLYQFMCFIMWQVVFCLCSNLIFTGINLCIFPLVSI